MQWLVHGSFLYCLVRPQGENETRYYSKTAVFFVVLLVSGFVISEIYEIFSYYIIYEMYFQQGGCLHIVMIRFQEKARSENPHYMEADTWAVSAIARLEPRWKK